VGYQTYPGNGGSPYKFYAPFDGCFQGSRVQLDGNGGAVQMPWDALSDAEYQAKGFTETMKGYGWNSGLNLAEDQLTVQSLTGTGSPFNKIGLDLGLLLLHCAYGTSMDCTANGCMQMYFPIISGTSGQYLPMSQMKFGLVAGNSGLKWMAIFACHSLDHNNWQSMQNQQVEPYTSNLHLLLGSDTDCWGAPGLMSYWARNMVNGTNNQTYSPLTIQNAWYQAANYCYTHTGQTYPTISLAVAGDVACMGDTLQTNSTPTGTWTYMSKEVYPTFTP
jgi:hypothetical protein